MERKHNDRQDFVTTHTLDNYPKELQKKVTLLQHFKSYLEGDNKNINHYEAKFNDFDNKNKT